MTEWFKISTQVYSYNYIYVYIDCLLTELRVYYICVLSQYSILYNYL